MFRKQHPEVGARPGTLIVPADSPKPRIRVVRYSAERVDDGLLADVSSLCRPDRADHDSTVTWIDVQGLGDTDLLHAIGLEFDLHPLALEDVVNVPQRPKADPYEDQLLIIGRVIRVEERLRLCNQQVSIVLGPNYVITFQEDYGDLFNPIHRRLARETARLRSHGADYLAYALLDTVVDTYYPAIESLGDQLERLEDRVLEAPSPALLRRLNLIKNRLVNLRRSIWPQREAVHDLIHSDTGWISDPVRIFLRDTYDHCVQTSEVVDMYRETATGLVNLYLSSVGHRTNEVMKTLTIVGSIFIPLTFVAGIYGMNFENMPELKWQWSYLSVWLMMLGIVAGMLWYFRHKGWLGGDTFAADDVTERIGASGEPVGRAAPVAAPIAASPERASEGSRAA